MLSFGNASSGIDRGSRIVAIKPSGVDYATLRPEDIILVSVDDGHVVEGTGRPSLDRPRTWSCIAASRRWGEFRIVSRPTAHELHTRSDIPLESVRGKWSGRRDSNPRHSAWEVLTS